MKDIRIGNDISVKWSLLVKGTSDPFDLSGLPLKLYLKNMYGRKEVEDFSVDGNVILWTFFGKDQKHTGKYSLELVANEGVEGMMTTDICDLVRLVSCSCKVGDGTDGCGVETETIEVQSEVEFVSGTLIEVDTELSETSMNPLANATVTAELKKKVSNTDLATINGQRIDEGGNIEIEGGSPYDDTEIRQEITELSEEVSGLSERIDNLPSGESDVFKAIYGETTYEEILEAITVGKLVYCIKDGLYYTLVSLKQDSRAWFACVTSTYIYRTFCNLDSSWTSETLIVENTAYKTKTINAESTDTQYPSAKAVYDAIQQSGTPSGDPMHYMYVAAGAEYNDTGADIERTGMYGDTIVWKNGYWWLNELGDITNEEIRTIYTCWKKTMDWAAYAPINGNFPTRTNFPFLGLPSKGFLFEVNPGTSQVFQNNGTIVKASVFWPTDWYGYHNLSELFTYCYSLETIIGVLGAASYGSADGMFRSCFALKDVQITHLKQTISFVSSSKLSNASILYMIEKEAATSAIVITLHADAYARAMADAEIVAALEAHPNVSLASA